MKKKGFTFIELLAVIVVLAIIIVLAVSLIGNIRKNALQKEYENVVSYIETKAVKYAEDTGFYQVNYYWKMIDINIVSYFIF